jgi:myosin heavy subunit
MDGSYDRQIVDLNTANAELKKEVIKLDSANKANEKLLSEKQGDIARLEEDKTALTNQIKGLNEQIEKIKAPPAAPGSMEEQKARKPEAQTSPKSLRIKILAGSGQLSKARAISGRLIALGYKVEKVDRAPRAYPHTTVYYSADSESEAKPIAKKIGAEVKPISWSSVFNIIVAVGKPPQQAVAKPPKEDTADKAPAKESEKQAAPKKE